MGSRRTSMGDTAAPPASSSTRLQTPPRVQRQLDKAARMLTTDAVEAARRQRQLDALVLSQIVSRAERIRLRARSHGRTPSGRALDEAREDETDGWSAATPLTLIELIQASSAVFDKHGIRPPQDAMYHRVLLTLSMDPERDWKLKIQRFAATQQPRIKRLSAGSVASGSGSVVAGRRGSMVSEASVKTPARRRTGVSEQAKTPRREAERRQSTQAADRFGDVLLATSSQSPKPPVPVVLKENQVSNASMATVVEGREVRAETSEQKLRELWRMRAKLEDLTEDLTLETDERDVEEDEGVNGGGEDSEVHNLDELEARRNLQRRQRELREMRERDARRELQVMREFQARQERQGEQEEVEQEDVNDDTEELRTISSHDSGDSSQISPAHKVAPAPVEVPTRSRRVSMGTFKLLASYFQQWKELMAFHRLVRESRAREMRLTQSILPPAATFAVFRWIALALPPCERSVSGENRAIPTFVLSRGVAVVNSPMLRHFTGRLLVWTLQRILLAWAKDARATKTVRIKSMIRRRTHVLETTVQCMRGWQAYAKHRRRVRDHGVWVETLHARRSLRLRWHLWRSAVETQRRSSTISASYGRKLTHRAFVLWALRVKKQKKAGRLGSRARLRRVMHEWRTATNDAREGHRLAQRADAWCRTRVLVKCWTPWRARCKENKSMRVKLAKWNHSRSIKMKRLWWVAWRQVHASRRMLHAKCARFVRWRMGRNLRLIVGAWAAHTQRRRQCELLVMDAVSRLEEKALRKVWSVWTRHFETAMDADDAKIHVVEAMQRAAIWWSWKRQTSTRRMLIKLRYFTNHGLSVAVWKSWRAYVDTQKHYRAIVETWRGDRDETMKLKAFRALVDNWQSGNKKQQVAWVFVGEGSRKRLRMYLWAWQQVAVTRRGQHQHDNSLVVAWRLQRMEKLWRSWRQAFHIAQCVHLADKSMAKGLQRRYWKAWRGAVRTRRGQTLVSRQLQVFRLRRSLKKLRFQVSENRLLQRLGAAIAERCKVHLLTRGWRGWRASLSVCKTRHVLVAEAVFTWQSRRLVACFQAWKAVQVKRKQLKLLLTSWWQAHRQRSVSTCWKSWLQYTSLRHERHDAMTQAAQYCVQRALAKSIRTWHRHCERSREKLVVVNQCVDLWAGNQCRHRFSRWKKFTRDRRKSREMDAIARTKRMHTAFQAWEQWKTIRDDHQLAQATLTGRLDQWRLKTAVKKLQLHALASTRMSSIGNLIRMACLRGQQGVFFHRWIAFVGKRKQERKALETAARSLQHFRQQQAIKRWGSVVCVKKLLVSTLLRAQSKTSAAIVSKIFSKWRQFVTACKLFHALKQKATVFRVFSTLPIYFSTWKRFVDYQRHRKQLILKASRLLCHHNEARAFKAWSSFMILKRHARKAMSMWRSQTLAQVWRRWRVLPAIEKAKARAMDFYETNLRRRVLREWRKEAHRKHLARHFSHLWHTQTAQTSFRTWAKHAKIQRSARVLLQRLRTASLGRVVNSWKLFVQSRQQRSAMIQYKFTLLWNQDRQMTSFQRWKAFIAQQTLLKERLRRHLQQQTAGCFIQWRTFVERSKSLKRLTDIVVRNRIKRVTSRMWSQWRTQKRARDAANGLRSRILNRTSDTFVKRLFGEWRGIVARSKLVNAMFSRLTNAAIGHVFKAWRHDYLTQRRRERALMVQVQRRCAHRLLAAVLSKMKSRVALKRACIKVFLPLIQRHMLSLVWGSWFEYHVQKQKTKALVARLQDELERRQPTLVSLLIGSIRRWKAPEQSRCFTHWRAMVNHQRWMRVKTVEALQFWQARQTKAFFAAWSAWKVRHQWKCSIAERSANHRRVRAWRKWLLYHQQHRSKALMLAKAMQLRLRRVQAAVIYTWRQQLAAQRHCRLVEAALMLRRTRRSVCFWHRRTVEMRAHRLQLTVASVAFNHKTLQSLWQQWVKYVSLVRTNRQELQQNTERLQVLVLCSAFRAWQAWSHRQHKINHVLALLSGRYSSNTARRVFHTWSHFAQAKKGHRNQADAFAYAMSVRRGLRALRACVEDRKLNRNAALRASKWTDLLHSRHTERVFRRWKQFTWLSSQAKRVVHRYHTQKLLPPVLQAWKAFLQDCRVKRERLAKALGLWQSMYMRRAWRAWMWYRLLRRKMAQAKLIALGFRTRRQLQSFLLGWRSVVVKKRLMGESCRKLLVRWRLQTAYRCFMSWQSYSLQRKTLHVSSVIITQQLTTRSLRTVWGEWRRQYIVVQVGKRKQLLRAWSQWTQWHHERERWKAFQIHQRDVLLRTVCARRGVQQWRQFVIQAKLGKTLAVLSSRFQKDTLVKRVFERWLAFLVVRHKEKEKMKRVLVWFHQRQLMQTFHALARHASVRKAKKVRLLTAEQFCRRRVSVTVIRAWHKAVALVLQQRTKLQHYVGVMQHLAQRKSFFAWREFAARRVELKANCAALLTQRMLLTTQSVFQEWRRFIVNSHNKKSATRMWETRLYRTSWRQWHRFVVLTKMERMLGASEQRLLERSLVEWRKRAALGKSTRLFSEQRQLRETKETLREVFTGWKKWSHIQTKCSSLLANVAVGSCLRFRFLLWKQFTMRSLKIKRLLNGVESPVVSATVSGTEGVTLSDDQATTTVAPSLQLARMARFFQRYEVKWGELSTVWQRWRHLFHARLFYRMRHLHKCFIAWQRWSKRHRFVRKLLAGRRHFRRQSDLKIVFSAWRQVVQTVKQIQQERRRERELWVIVNTEILRRERNTLQQHWNAWRQRVEDKHHLLVSVSAYQRARILTKFWLLWAHDFANVMKRERHDERRRIGRMHALKKTRAVRELKEFARRHRHVRTTVARLKEQRERKLCARGFAHWQTITAVRRRVRMLIAYKKCQRLRAAMAMWAKWLDACRQHQRYIEKYVRDRERRVCVFAFKQWHAYLRHRQQMDEMNVIAVKFCLCNAIHKRWRRAVQSKMNARTRAQAAEEAMVTWRQQRSLRRWHRASRLERLRRKMCGFILRKFLAFWKSHTQHAVAVRFDVFQRRKLAGVAMRQWHVVAATRVRRRQVEFEIVKAHERRIFGDVWSAWQDFVAIKRQKQHARSHYDSVVKLKWFLHWFDVTKDLQHQREERLAVADEFHARAIARRVLNTLARTVQANQQRRAVLLICMVKIQRALHARVQHVVFRLWADAADRARYSRDCSVVLEQSRLRRSLATWQRTITDRKRNAKTQQDALAYHRQRLLSVRFFQWQNYALAWKDAERMQATVQRPKVPPPPPIQTTRRPQRVDEDDDEGDTIRHPLSPIAKRFHAKNQAKMLHEELDMHTPSTPPMPSFSDAAALSLDVKKRLIVLGKWKPSHKSLHQS